MDNTTAVSPLLQQVASELSVPKPMRRGSVSERTIKCSKPGCACARDPKARHGPYYSLTRAVKGKTRSRFLTTEQVALARQQVENGREFRETVEQYWQQCEEWADAQLATPAAVSTEEAEKGGSPHSCKTKSRRRSKPY